MKKITLLSCFMVFALMSYAQRNEDPMQIMKLYDQASMALKLNNVDDAIEFYEKIARLMPNLPDVYVMLGDAYAQKTNDAVAIEKSIQAYRKYLQLDPKANNADDVQAAIHQMEYMATLLKKKENMGGRWASNIDGDDPSLFILDIQDIRGNIRVNMEPSSAAAFTRNIINRTSYAELTDDGGYFVHFADNETYTPSQAGYNLARGATNLAIGQLGGQLGGFLGMASNFAIDLAQEKDIAKNTRKIYGLKLMPIGNKFEGVLHYVHKEASQSGEKVFTDSIIVLNFDKVNKNFINQYPVEYYRKSYIPAQYAKLLKGQKEQKIKMDWAEFNKNATMGKEIIKSNPDAFKYYKQSRSHLWGGFGVTMGGIALLAPGILFMAMDEIDIGAPLTGVGSAMIGSGIIAMSVSPAKAKKAARVHNASITQNKKSSIVSQIDINLKGNGLGLALTF